MPILLNMLRFLLVFLLALPLVELYVLFQLTGFIGFWQTLIIVLITGLVGAEIIRREGRHVLWKLTHSVSAGEISRNILEGGLLVVSGLFLLTPGIITDLIGFLIVLRPLRERLVAHIMNKNNFSGQMEIRTFQLFLFSWR